MPSAGQGHGSVRTAVVPIGEALLVEGLKRRFPNAEFYVSTTRPPSVYRGNPFVVEGGLAFGGDLPLDEPADIMRFANRVPLQYQPKACAISESVYHTNWRGYELQQPKGSLPIAPMAIAVHLASVWVPFTSEAKEAVAHYDDLLREMKLAIQECGRKLASHIRARAHAEREQKRRSLFQKYIPEVAQALAENHGPTGDRRERPFMRLCPSSCGSRTRTRPEGAAAVTATEVSRARRPAPDAAGQGAAPERQRDGASSRSSGVSHGSRRRRRAGPTKTERDATRWQKIERMATRGSSARRPREAIRRSRSERALCRTSSFNEKRKIIELGDRTQSREFFNTAMARKFMQTILVASGCKKLIDEGKTSASARCST